MAFFFIIELNYVVFELFLNWKRKTLVPFLLIFQYICLYVVLLTFEIDMSARSVSLSAATPLIVKKGYGFSGFWIQNKLVPYSYLMAAGDLEAFCYVYMVFVYCLKYFKKGYKCRSIFRLKFTYKLENRNPLIWNSA